MHARMTRYEGAAPEAIEDNLQTKKGVLPTEFGQTEGMKGAMFLIDRERGTVVIISLWKDEHEMRASEDGREPDPARRGGHAGCRLAVASRSDLRTEPQGRIRGPRGQSSECAPLYRDTVPVRRKGRSHCSFAPETTPPPEIARRSAKAASRCGVDPADEPERRAAFRWAAGRGSRRRTSR